MSKFSQDPSAKRWRSDEGYTLEFTDSSRAPWLKFEDASHVVFTSTELLGTKGVGFALFTDQMYFDRPKGPPVGDPALRQMVAQCVQALFDHLQWKLEIM